MAKVSRVPSGFYTGKEAARRLSMSTGTFYKQVKAGKIEKFTLPNSTEGYYSKEQIEKLAQAKELFILLYSIEPTVFTRATSEDDVRGIVDMCVAIYGVGSTPSYETRLAIWHKCPEVYYVLKQEDIVVGYVSLIRFNDTALNVLMDETPKVTTPSTATAAGTGVYSVTGPENLIPFTPGQPIDSLFISLAVRPGLSNLQQREYGFKLLRDTLDVIQGFAKRGMPVRMLYATSEKQDGIRLAKKLGMREIAYPGDKLVRFELDLEHSTFPLAEDYRRAIKEYLSQAEDQIPA